MAQCHSHLRTEVTDHRRKIKNFEWFVRNQIQRDIEERFDPSKVRDQNFIIFQAKTKCGFHCCRVGTHVYNPRLFEIVARRSTSSNERKVCALVCPPFCLGGGLHGWVPVDTHSTPVPTALGRLWVAWATSRAQWPQENARLHFPKRDEVQNRRRRWQAQELWIARLRRPWTQRVLNSLSSSTFSRGRSLSWDVVGNSFLQNRASSDTSKVEMNSNGISNEGKAVPRYFLSCKAETARDTHLRVASSLATATIRRWLRCTRTRRTLWKLTGRSWMSPSRWRQWLNPQTQEGTPRVETARVFNAEAQVEYQLQMKPSCEATRCSKKWTMRRPMINSDSCSVWKTWTQCMSVSGCIRDQCASVRVGRSAAPRLSMTDVASPRTTPRWCRLRKPRTTGDSSCVSPWAVTGNSQSRRASGSRTLASFSECSALPEFGVFHSFSLFLQWIVVWRRTEMTCRRPVHCTASAPRKESSRSHAADSTVVDGVMPSMSEKLMNEEVDEVIQRSNVDLLPGSTRSWTRIGRGGVQEHTSTIHVSSKS